MATKIISVYMCDVCGTDHKEDDGWVSQYKLEWEGKTFDLDVCSKCETEKLFIEVINKARQRKRGRRSNPKVRAEDLNIEETEVWLNEDLVCHECDRTFATMAGRGSHDRAKHPVVLKAV